MKVHWKAPLQTKGFLKIIELVVAILCFSLVAGFSYSGSGTCVNTSGSNYSLVAQTNYPLFSYTLTNRTVGADFVTTYHRNFGDVSVGQGAQLFVAWGVLTMFYCVIAIVVYMLVTANEEWEKIMDFLVYADLVFHIAWVLCWFIASIDWAVAFNRLIGDVASEIRAEPNCANIAVTHSNTAQAAIAVVFGFLSLFLWGANIYWVLIDTLFYIQWKAKRTGDYTP